MIKIRKATPKDLKEIQRFAFLLLKKEKQDYSKYLNPNWVFSKEGQKYHKDRITKKQNCALIAEYNKKIVGFLVGGIKTPESFRELPLSAELIDMFVLEKYRNQKIGTLLYNEFLKWCKSKKVGAIRVSMAAKNNKVIKFYKKRKFEEMVLIMEHYLK